MEEGWREGWEGLVVVAEAFILLNFQSMLGVVLNACTHAHDLILEFRCSLFTNLFHVCDCECLLLPVSGALLHQHHISSVTMKQSKAHKIVKSSILLFYVSRYVFPTLATHSEQQRSHVCIPSRSHCYSCERLHKARLASYSSPPAALVIISLASSACNCASASSS